MGCVPDAKGGHQIFAATRGSKRGRKQGKKLMTKTFLPAADRVVLWHCHFSFDQPKSHTNAERILVKIHDGSTEEALLNIEKISIPWQTKDILEHWNYESNYVVYECTFQKFAKSYCSCFISRGPWVLLVATREAATQQPKCNLWWVENVQFAAPASKQNFNLKEGKKMKKNLRLTVWNCIL